MESINVEAQEYTDNLPSWVKVRDCVAGSVAVKKKGVIYLPRPSPQDNNPQRYDDYILRANFFNATARTLEGLLGAVWRKNPKVDLPPQLEYMTEDADGSGCSLTQCAKETLSDVLQVGRTGLLVDFPKIDGDQPITLEAEDALNLRASIVQYKAEQIINWGQMKIGAETVLQFVVLKEKDKKDNPDNIFKCEEIVVYRVLALDESGFYYQEEYVSSSSETVNNDFILRAPRSYPKTKEGANFNRIPFVFIGSKDLKPSVDKAPILDLAEINLAHYRNSADVEELGFMIGQPTLKVIGLTPNWIKDQWKNKPLRVGARSAIELPQGADADFMQVSESQIGMALMAQKIDYMVAIGARLVLSNPVGVEAAETVRLKFTGEASILANSVQNVTEGYNQVLVYSAQFMGADPEKIVFVLNMDFFSEKITPDEARAFAEMWQKGIYSLKDLRDILRKGELIREDKDDEEIDREINEEITNFPALTGGEIE